MGIWTPGTEAEGWVSEKQIDVRRRAKAIYPTELSVLDHTTFQPFSLVSTHLSNLIIPPQLLVRTPQERIKLMSEMFRSMRITRSVLSIQEFGEQEYGGFRANIYSFEKGKDIRREELYINKTPNSQFSSHKRRSSLY